MKPILQFLNYAKALPLLMVLALPATAAQTYQDAGVVLKVNPERSEIEISMNEIPGFMDAMVMPLHVHQPLQLRGLRSGDMVDFKLVVTADDSYADDLHVHHFMSLENDPQGACRLAVVEKLMGKPADSVPALAIGQHVPDFALTDQTGQKVSLSQFAGKVVALTFVYTRCPLPNFCFRLSNNFGQVQKRFSQEMGQDLILLTITLDPATDQKDALAKYASIWKANPAWHFLTGSPDAVKRITGMFSVVSNQDEGTITHSLHSVIIDRKGNLAANLEGNEFTAKQLGDLVELKLHEHPQSAAVEVANKSHSNLGSQQSAAE